MNPRAWVSAFREAIRSMTQSTMMSLASVATVAVSLLVLSSVLLLAFNLEHMATSVEQQVEIRAFLCSAKDDTSVCRKQELTSEQRAALIAKLKAMPEVKQVAFVTREEALAKMRELFKEKSDMFDSLGENPLRDSLQVQVNDVNQVKAVSDTMAKLQGVGEVKYGQEYVDKLLSFTRAIRLGGIVLVVLLIIATVLTLANTIRLAVYARRREISIMKLVGATDWYIRRPFMLEGIFLGVLGAVLSMAITGAGYSRIVDYLYQNVPFLPVVPADGVLLNLTSGLVLLGAVLGALGSLVSMRRFLKV